MNRRTKIAIGTVGAAVIIGIGAGTATATGALGDDVPLTGADLERASEAALAETGGGTVVDSEANEESAYEIEVNLDDGRQIEVHLDENFAVVDATENEEGDDGD